MQGTQSIKYSGSSCSWKALRHSSATHPLPQRFSATPHILIGRSCASGNLIFSPLVLICGDRRRRRRIIHIGYSRFDGHRRRTATATTGRDWGRANRVEIRCRDERLASRSYSAHLFLLHARGSAWPSAGRLSGVCCACRTGSDHDMIGAS